jgi:hypothetical protein
MAVTLENPDQGITQDVDVTAMEHVPLLSLNSGGSCTKKPYFSNLRDGITRTLLDMPVSAIPVVKTETYS